jgi:hypothetical protein
MENKNGQAVVEMALMLPILLFLLLGGLELGLLLVTTQSLEFQTGQAAIALAQGQDPRPFLSQKNIDAFGYVLTVSGGDVIDFDCSQVRDTEDLSLSCFTASQLLGQLDNPDNISCALVDSYRPGKSITGAFPVPAIHRRAIGAR